MYSDETSMANCSGNNWDSTLPVVTPQAVEEPKVGLIPKLKLSRLHHFLVVKGSLWMHHSNTSMSKVLLVQMTRLDSNLCLSQSVVQFWPPYRTTRIGIMALAESYSGYVWGATSVGHEPRGVAIRVSQCCERAVSLCEQRDYKFQVQYCVTWGFLAGY